MGCRHSKERDVVSPVATGASSSVETSPLVTSSGGVDLSVRSGRGVVVHNTGMSGGSSTHSSEGSWHGSSGLDESTSGGGTTSGGSHRNGMSTTTARSNKPTLAHSGSVLGLDTMIESRREEGDLKTNVVHIEVPFGKPIEEVYDGVHTGVVLGSGISGLVRLVTHKATGVQYAVKCLDLGLVETEEGLLQLREEIYIMCQLDHPNIVRLEEVYESHSEIYLVQELCYGGELFDRLDDQPDYHYTEAQCARLVKQMMCSVRYLHLKGIIHRDLKLENFLFSTASPDSELKMIDFGLSKHFKFGEVQHEAVGTPYTVSPEVIKGSYDERCDIWAIGVIAFLLLSGDPPFGGCGGPESLMEVRSNILRGKFAFEPQDIWANVSSVARDFIRCLLVTDPNKRPTAREAQKHKWLQEWASRSRKASDNTLNANVVKALVTFKEYSDMRKLLCEVLSFTLLPEQIQDLRVEFEKMDTDGSGEISLTALKKVLMENAGAGSLGALTEEEVQDIFDAMRVRKSETRIHWHEFIAASLSQCKVDDRNLRLAFDRLDNDHKGFITFENVMDLLGNDGAQSEDAMRAMWGDSMKATNCHHARITYADFLLLMKGQTKEGMTLETEMMTVPSSRSHMELVAVQEGVPMDEADEDSNGILTMPSGDKVVVENGTIIGGGTGVVTFKLTEEQGRRASITSTDSGDGQSRLPISVSAPTTPMGRYGKATDERESDSDGPVTMDNEEMVNQLLASSAVDRKRGYMVPEPHAFSMSVPEMSFEDEPTEESPTPSLPLYTPKIPLPDALPDNSVFEYMRQRSRSVDDKDHIGEGEKEEEETTFKADTSRALGLPEHIHMDKKIESIINDNKATPLVVNRTLYRAHRQMRLAVMEASKRFEDEQTRRAREALETTSKTPRYGAGLVMRHGRPHDISPEMVRLLVQKKEMEQRTLVEKASRRGGRGRRTRKKTTSDMTGMLASVPPEELILDSAPEQAAIPEPMPLPRLPKITILEEEEEQPSAPLRTATIPGVFRKTVDPFAVTRRLAGELTKSEAPKKPDVLSNSSIFASLKTSHSDGKLDEKVPEPPSPTLSPTYETTEEWPVLPSLV
jgi:calcium-dependent protein kinase